MVELHPCGTRQPVLTGAGLQADQRKQARAALRSLTPDKRHAVVSVWQHWDAPAAFCAAAWQHAHDEEHQSLGWLSAHDRYRLDWLRRRSAVPLGHLFAWHSATAEALSLLPAGDKRADVAVLCGDAVNLPDARFAVLAAAEAARQVCTLGGKPAARLFCERLYEGCLPDARLTARTVRSVPAFVFAGRVYVL